MQDGNVVTTKQGGRADANAGRNPHLPLQFARSGAAKRGMHTVDSLIAL